MPLRKVHCRVLDQIVDTFKLPGSGRPWVLVKEVPAILNLEFVEGAAEFDVLDRFLHLDVELLLLPWLLAVHRLVELLENTEVCAGWGPYQKIGGFLLHPLPR